jgi:hypothetical protein
LISSNTSAGTVKLTSLPRATSVLHPIAASSTSAATISLVTQTATSPTTQPGTGTIKTPLAVLAPVKTSGIKPIGTAAGSSVLGGIQSHSH